MTFGFAFKSAEFTDSREAVRLLRGDNIGQGRLRWDGAKRFPQERVGEVTKYQLAIGDVVLAMDRPWIEAGLKYSVVRSGDVPSLLVQRVARLRAKPALDQGYLAAVIGSKEFMDYIVGTQTGSAVPHISGGQIGDFQVDRLPPLAEQAAIARILGVIDDKIESNRRSIALIEELGASLLANALGRETSEVPTLTEQLDSILTVIESGSRPRGGALTDGSGVISLGAESIQSAGVINTKTFKSVPSDYAASMKRGHLANADVLVYKDGGTPGKFIPHVSAFGFGFPVEQAVINEHVYRVRADGRVSQGTLYWLLSSSWMDDEMRRRGTGAAIPGINSTNFREMPIPNMANKAVQEIGATLDQLLERVLRLGTESRRLGSIRDALLPELLSGRIRVPVEESAA
ncbi:restriction endonuclease subunit S [Microbacterium sp. PM5]|uniref:restriction endonuclease subunit S n=1 Tax=Microbacterium sp. PM5 TaxID=2014534 RepID=UPI0013AF3A99|nr:restriction endonuclease subunit S [Microbacterium sp. PM5]